MINIPRCCLISVWPRDWGSFLVGDIFNSTSLQQRARMWLQRPRFPAAHDLSLAANIFPVKKTTMQEYTPDPEVMPLACFIAGLVCQSNKDILLHPGSRLIRTGFREVSNFFVLGKAYPSVRCLFS